MEILKLVKAESQKTLKWLIVLIIVGIMAGLGIFGYYYFGSKIWQASFELFQKLPAALLSQLEREPAGETPLEIQEALIIGEREYTEKAEAGEGVTHLARRALKNYLQVNPVGFEITSEHKIYAEDYIAKKIGQEALILDQELEFPEDLIKEAIQKAETLTPEQLQNLEQYSQLVPSLNY